MAKIAKISVVMPSKVSAADEKGLAKCFDAMLSSQKDIDDVLAEVGKTTPMPSALDDSLKKRLTLAKSRAAEIKDMAKDRAKATLHSNPGKMARVYKDLNEDVAQANWLEGGIGEALDDHFDDVIKALAVSLARGLPKGVTPGHLDLVGTIKRFKEKNSKEGWGRYAANVVTLEKDLAKDVAEVQREQGIRGLATDSDFGKLKYAVRQKVVDAGIKSATATEATVRTVLLAALEKQRKPTKGSWASYLELGAGGSYSLRSGGSFQGMAIHLTMSKDSWTADADGSVSVAGNSVQTIYEDLLKVDGWKQLHATLEVSASSADYPHVFLFAGVLSGDRKWEAARQLVGRDAKWVTDAQAAMKSELQKVEDAIKKKITEAKAQEGANVA